MVMANCMSAYKERIMDDDSPLFPPLPPEPWPPEDSEDEEEEKK